MKNLGYNCIQNFNLGRYIVIIGNLVLRRGISIAVKCDFGKYNRGYTSPNENFKYNYSHYNAIETVSLKKGSENVVCCAYVQLFASCIKPLVSP